MQTNDHIYDYVFVGIGVSTVLHCLSKGSLYNGKSVLFIESGESFDSSKTICGFYKTNEIPINSSFDSFSVKIRDKKLNFKSETPYAVIDLKSCFKRFQDDFGLSCMRFEEQVLNVEKNVESFIVSTNKGRYLSQNLIDSRLPNLSEYKYLKQHFFGQFFEFSKEHNIKNPILMDIKNHKSNFHFFYLIPVTPKKLLVETTHFGREKSSIESYTYEIDEYMKSNFSDAEFQSVAKEMGCIPMLEITSNIKIFGYKTIGVRSGALRSSTGYSAFQSMSSAKKTFLLRQMDKFLLRILWRDSTRGVEIFTKFFSNLDGETISNFLGPKPSLNTLIRVVLSMPFSLFLFELFKTPPKFNPSFKLRSLND